MSDNRVTHMGQARDMADAEYLKRVVVELGAFKIVWDALDAKMRRARRALMRAYDERCWDHVAAVLFAQPIEVTEDDVEWARRSMREKGGQDA